MSRESTAGNLALATGSSGGILIAVNEYATVISLSLTALGIFAGIFFHFLAYQERKRERKTREELRDEIRRELLGDQSRN